MLIEQIIFEIDNFIMQLFDKFTRMIGQRIAHIDQPATAVGRPGTFFQIIDHVIQRKHFTLTRRHNQAFVHIEAHGHQLIGALVGTAINAAQGNKGALAKTTHPRTHAIARQGITYVIGKQRG
ncbi:hypothetical protein D3C78_1604260 [compost metagenome]